MMTRKTPAMLLAVFLVFVTLATSVLAYPTSYGIDIDHQTQAQSKWCWAACASVVLDYYSQTVSQSSFVTYVKGSALNVGASELEVKNGLAHWGISSTQTTSYLSFNSVMSELYTYSRPIYAGWTWLNGGSGGHAVLIDEYGDDSTDYVDYMDPADGSYHYVTYTWFVGGAGYNHVWDGTLKAIHD